MLVSRIHRKKPPQRPMPANMARANAKKSAVRAHVEHIFAEQKARMGLFVRTIGLARATMKIGLANTWSTTCAGCYGSDSSPPKAGPPHQLPRPAAGGVAPNCGPAGAPPP